MDEDLPGAGALAPSRRHAGGLRAPVAPGVRLGRSGPSWVVPSA